MANKLAAVKCENKYQKLTERNKVNFKIYIGDNLEKKYTFEDVQQKNSHEFCRFLGKTLGKDWNYVAKNYQKKTDKTDFTEKGQQIIHLKFSRAGRIHGYLENGVFVLIRFDPNHKKHGN